MRRLWQWLKSISFSAKILLIVTLAVLPMVAITLISMLELRISTDEKHMTLIENNYTQTCSTLEEKMQEMHAISTLMTVSDQVNTALRSADKQDIRQQLAAFETISSYARTVEMSHEGISIFLFVEDEYLVAQDRSTRYRGIRALSGSGWLDRLQAEQGHPVWGFTEDILEKGRGSLTQVRMLMDHLDFTRSLGILAVSMGETQVQDILANALDGQYLCLCQADGTILMDNGADLPPTLQEMPAPTDGRFVIRNIGQEAYYLNMTELNDSGLYLLSILPRSLISQGFSDVQKRVLLSYLAVFFLMALVLIPVTSGMLGGILQLRRQLAQVSEQGLRKLRTNGKNDEIGQLIAAYNTMVDEIERMLKTQYELGRSKVGAELKALQSQINPHFLYNTLDMVSWMAKKQETDKIQQVMQALSQFYKLTLSGGRDVITLQEELRLCDAFMQIQQLRWQGAIDYLVEADDELLHARLPKITLQPLIENAIKHGIMQRDQAEGSIMVSVIRAEDKPEGWMTLSVLDNGVGMEDGEAAQPRPEGNHYGMCNIEQRLSLFFNTDITLQVDSEAGLGTCVSITIPIIDTEEVRQS